MSTSRRRRLQASNPAGAAPAARAWAGRDGGVGSVHLPVAGLARGCPLPARRVLGVQHRQRHPHHRARWAFGVGSPAAAIAEDCFDLAMCVMFLLGAVGFFLVMALLSCTRMS